MDNSQIGAIASYSCQFWRNHFLNVGWFQTLENAAISVISDRIFDVQRFMPDSSLQTVLSRVRTLTPEEASLNGRTFAQETFCCIEFSLLEADLEAIRHFAITDEAVRESIHPDLFVAHSVMAELETFCDIILFLVNLTFCGVFQCENKQLRFGDRLESDHRPAIFGLPRSKHDYSFLDGGVRQCVSFDEVLEWSTGCKGIWTNRAITRVEKAVSFLSHTFSAESAGRDEAIMLWSTAGLETLACDGQSSISVQLKRRLPLICDLIPFRSVVKGVSTAYDFRSRLFHGNISTINSFNRDEVGQNDNRYDSKLAEYGLMLQLMVIAVIWKAIERKSYILTFEETASFS